MKQQLYRRVEGLAPMYTGNYSGTIPSGRLSCFHDDYTIKQHYQFVGQDLSNKEYFKIHCYGYRMIMKDDNATLIAI